MNVLRVMSLGVLLLAAPAFAGEAEDAAYDALVAAAMKAPKSVNYLRMREMFAETKYYADFKTKSSSLMGKYIMGGEPASQALKDEAVVVLKTEFALPQTHPALIAIMDYRQGMAETEFHAAAYQGLLQAIIDSGDGESAATARVILQKSEGEIVLESMGVLGNDWRRRDVEEGGRTFYVYNVKNSSWSSLWAGDRYEIWFDATAFQGT